MSTGSHFEFEFLHEPIVYGFARLLYVVTTSASMIIILDVQRALSCNKLNMTNLLDAHVER